jgi:hypothetical protein
MKAKRGRPPFISRERSRWRRVRKTMTAICRVVCCAPTRIYGVNVAPLRSGGSRYAAFCQIGLAHQSAWRLRRDL